MSGGGAPTYPAKTIAKLLNLTERRVQQLAKEGVIPRAERGRYELAPAVQGYVRYLQDRLAGNHGGAEVVDYHKEKARKIKAEADIAEIEAAKLRGAVIEAAEVKRAWGLILGEIRGNLIGATPARIAQLVRGVEDELQIKGLVRAEIESAMQAAADADVGVLFAAAEGAANDGAVQ